MKFTVRIRRNADGKIAEHHDDQPAEYMPNQEDGFFIWEEGNYACDCNRHIFFCSVTGESDADRKCGDSAYSVLDITFENGDVYYPDGKDGK